MTDKEKCRKRENAEVIPLYRLPLCRYTVMPLYRYTVLSFTIIPLTLHRE